MIRNVNWNSSRKLRCIHSNGIECWTWRAILGHCCLLLSSINIYSFCCFWWKIASIITEECWLKWSIRFVLTGDDALYLSLHYSDCHDSQQACVGFIFNFGWENKIAKNCLFSQDYSKLKVLSACGEPTVQIKNWPVFIRNSLRFFKTLRKRTHDTSASWSGPYDEPHWSYLSWFIYLYLFCSACVSPLAGFEIAGGVVGEDFCCNLNTV